MAKKPNKADQMTYKALLKAIKEDKIRIYFDYIKLNRPGSKVYNPWECLLPVLVPTFIGLILIIAFNIIFGLISMIALIIGSTYYCRKKIYLRIIDRTKAMITSSYENMAELWNFGGIVLVNNDNKKQGCVSPEGDWKEFVIINYAEYMIDKKDTEKEENKDEKAPRTTPRHRGPTGMAGTDSRSNQNKKA